MNIFITGASGSMAHYMVDYLKRQAPDARVSGIARKAKGVDGLDSYRSFDLWDSPIRYLIRILKEELPDYIFHFASEANVRESFDRPREFIQSNVSGTCKLFEAIRDAGIKPRVLLASTSEVYGDPVNGDAIDESTPFAPLNPYATTKCAQEHLALCFMQAYNIPVVITRAFGYINPRRADLFATAMARQILRDQGENNPAVIRHGNLLPVRTFCDVRDMAEAYWLAAQRGTPGHAYNIGSTEFIKLRELLDRLIAMSNVPVRKEDDLSLYRPTDIGVCIPATKKFESISSGWRPKIPLEDSLRWLFESVIDLTRKYS